MEGRERGRPARRPWPEGQVFDTRSTLQYLEQWCKDHWREVGERGVEHYECPGEGTLRVTLEDIEAKHRSDPSYSACLFIRPHMWKARCMKSMRERVQMRDPMCDPMCEPQGNEGVERFIERFTSLLADVETEYDMWGPCQKRNKITVPLSGNC
jgi:hypothetical protein